MKAKYTARIYLEANEILNKSGDEVEELYTWLLVQAEGKFGSVHGEITENKSKQVVKQFRKTHLPL